MTGFSLVKLPAGKCHWASLMIQAMAWYIYTCEYTHTYETQNWSPLTVSGDVQANFLLSIKLDTFSLKLLVMTMIAYCFCWRNWEWPTRSHKLVACQILTPKQLEMHGCWRSTVATDDLVLKHQAINIHRWLGSLLWNYPQVNVIGLHWWFRQWLGIYTCEYAHTYETQNWSPLTVSGDVQANFLLSIKLDTFSLKLLVMTMIAYCFCWRNWEWPTRSHKLVACQILTPKQLEMHGCWRSTVATDDLVLKHQAISIHSADYISMG